MTLLPISDALKFALDDRAALRTNVKFNSNSNSLDNKWMTKNVESYVVPEYFGKSFSRNMLIIDSNLSD